MMLQDLKQVSSGTTQGPMATSLSAQLELFPLAIRSVLSAFPTACTEGH